MFRMVGFTEPIEAPIDTVVDGPEIVGLHYLHGSLDHLDPFSAVRKQIAGRWWPTSDSRVWTYDEGDGQPLPDVVWFVPHAVRANDGKRMRAALGQCHLLCHQLGGSGFNTSGYLIDGPYSGGGDEAMNYDERFATDTDDLVIMPVSVNDVPFSSTHWELIIKTRRLVWAGVTPDTEIDWLHDPTVNVQDRPARAPTVEQCKAAATRWRNRYKREWIPPEFNRDD